MLSLNCTAFLLNAYHAAKYCCIKSVLPRLSSSRDTMIRHLKADSESLYVSWDFDVCLHQVVDQNDEFKLVMSQHCLASLSRQTTINIS